MYNDYMGKSKATRKNTKRTGIMGVIMAVGAIIGAVRTLTTYHKERKNKK